MPQPDRDGEAVRRPPARFSRWFLSYGLNHPGPVDPGQTADIEELSRVSLAVIPVLAQLHEQDFAAGSDKA